MINMLCAHPIRPELGAPHSISASSYGIRMQEGTIFCLSLKYTYAMVLIWRKNIIIDPYRQLTSFLKYCNHVYQTKPGLFPSIVPARVQWHCCCFLTPRLPPSSFWHYYCVLCTILQWDYRLTVSAAQNWLYWDPPVLHWAQYSSGIVLVPVVVPGETALPARGLPTPITMVSFSTVQPSLNQEFLCT